MKDEKELENPIYYFDNACRRRNNTPDEFFLGKVRTFLQNLSPTKIWEGVGINNKKMKVNLYPDFVILLDKKIIACEVELQNLRNKFLNYSGMKIFDEIWFFTEIHSEKKHLHYKFDNDLKILTKFFGLNDNGQIVNIK